MLCIAHCANVLTDSNLICTITLFSSYKYVDLHFSLCSPKSCMIGNVLTSNDFLNISATDPVFVSKETNLEVVEDFEAY